MTFELMKENLKTIKLLEKDLMRDLTEEEKEIVINNVIIAVKAPNKNLVFQLLSIFDILFLPLFFR